MKYAALVFAFFAGPAVAQDAPAPGPEEARFARDMIACGQKYVALKLLAPGNATPTEIIADGRAYLDAATQAAGDAFVERETPAIRQAVMDDATKIVTGGSRETSRVISRLKRDCDAKLAAQPRH